MSNPLYRYLHGGKKKTSHRRVSTMARRSRRGRRSSRGFGGMNKWLKVAAYSGGAAILGAQFLPNVSDQIKGAAGGFLAGGIPGAVVGYLAAPTIKGLVGNVTGGSMQPVGYRLY